MQKFGTAERELLRYFPVLLSLLRTFQYTSYVGSVAITFLLFGRDGQKKRDLHSGTHRYGTMVIQWVERARSGV